MISACGLAFIRGGRRLVDDVSLDLTPGAMTVVIGPNGAGKSTLLKLMTGELAPDQGSVTVDGRDVAALSARELAERRAVLPQSLALSFPFTALEIVRMGAIAYGSLTPERDARAALARVGLGGFEGRSYQALSGGEQQRVQFARVLAQVPRAVENGRPKALFLDEPTSSLDIGHQIAVLEIARDFSRDGGAVLAILHDLNLAAEFADRLLVLHRGRVVASGAPADTLSDRTVSDVYGISGAVGRVPPPHIPFVLPQARHG
ncbi:heme ABC transporter ATP-binding protein [Rhizobiaceae bacterium BDR2-2]|uniref:Heme ABC transporter ATP-binding protein n=1 Tax=Ectorhizobium quercum TaxID=2965071 RepID=A0AAE3N2W4_9HYPH|nr:heme ABC transporter ATP-binding protein [Ectorhizobium quercum]MCX8999589.1 heme ABC transporter ATP-binding protein [Ectorhizobium quercum]